MHTEKDFFIMCIYKISYLTERPSNYICITPIWIQFGILPPLKMNF